MKKALSRIAALILVVMVLLSSVSALADYAAVVRKAMPVYSDARLTHRIGTVPKWMIAIVKGGYNGTGLTYKLNVNGKICYADSKYLASDQDILDVFLPKGYNDYPTIKTVRTCKVYAYPSTGSKSVTVKAGRQLNKIAENKNWILCGSGVYLGYIQKKDVR